MLKSTPGSFFMAKRMEVLSRPVTGIGRRPSTRKRVELKGLSSMRRRRAGTVEPARHLGGDGGHGGIVLARSAAAAVDEVSSVATSGRFAASHCRHWASPAVRDDLLDLAELAARDRR